MNVGIVGCGAVVTELHSSALTQLELKGQIRITGAVDSSSSRAINCAKRFKWCKSYSDINLALKEQQFDVVLVASPPAHHFRHCKAVLESGGNVLCEKPLTVSSVECLELNRIALQKGLVIAVGMTRRFVPSVASAKAFLSSNLIGNVRRFSYREGDAFAWPLSSDAIFRRQISGGGVLTDKGVHVIDMLQWIFGSFDIVSAEDDANRGGVEANVVVQVCGDEFSGRIQLSWDQALRNGLHITGDKGEALFDLGSFDGYSFRVFGQEWIKSPTNSTWIADLDRDSVERSQPRGYDECILLQWVNVLRRILHGKGEYVDAMTAAETMSHIEKCYAICTPIIQTWRPRPEIEYSKGNHWRNEVGG